jgi:ABC-type lipoprotein export system ATPase subunit
MNFLTLEHVSKVFDTGPGVPPLTVLDDISLTVQSGESVAVTGPSGSGKSTLLNIIGTLDSPTSGTVTLAGREVSSLSEKECARVRNEDIGFIFQLHHLLPQCTVLENVLIPSLPAGNGVEKENTYKRACMLLDRVGLADRMDYLPGTLSGGERQRAAVVRALVNKPSLLLADEPTGALDHTTAKELIELLVELNREEQVILIMVTHAEEFAQSMQRICKLCDAKLQEEK